MSNIEIGRHNNILLLGSTVSKTSIRTYDEETANALATDLTVYDSELAAEPLIFTRLHSVEVVPDTAQRFRISHTVSRVKGSSVASLPEENRQHATAHILRRIGAMSTMPRRSDTLRTPIDAKVENYHVDALGPTLVDIFPPLIRNADGVLPAFGLNRMQPAPRLREWVFGSKSGVMSRVLASAIGRNQDVSRLRASYDWCHDALPTDLDPTVRARIERQIAMRFMPYLVSVKGPITIMRKLGKKH